MRGWLGLVLVAGACGGKDDGGTTDADTTDDTLVTVDPCDGMPVFDLAGVTCSQAASVWEDLVAFSDSCNTASDCSLLRAECEHWNEVGCYYAHNACFTPALIGDLNAAAANCASTQVCACTGDPSVDCVGGSCVVVDE